MKNDKLTKKEARARRAAWNLALAEGRMIRSPDGLTMTSFPTVEETLAALSQLEGWTRVQIPANPS